MSKTKLEDTDDLFQKLAAGTERLRELARRANAIGCALLSHRLAVIAGDIDQAIAIQRLALAGSPDAEMIRYGRCPTCRQTRHSRNEPLCQDAFHWWICGLNCPSHYAGDPPCETN